MKRFLCLLLLLPAWAGAQVPVEDDILARTLDSSSPYYYTTLMMRYRAGDPTLTDLDYHYLYYGYAYQESYKPLIPVPELDKLLLLASSVDTENPQKETLEAIIATGNDVLARDPFSPKVLNLMAFAYDMLGDKEQAAAYAARMNGVLRAVLASGDGLSQQSPRHVLT